MDAQQSKAAFEQASELFAGNKFIEALRILNELNKAFPGDKNILFPMAKCMANTDRHEEAKKICAFLAQKFSHPGAQELLDYLETSPEAINVPGLDNFDSGLCDLDAGVDLNSDFNLDDVSPSPTVTTQPAPLEKASAFEEALPYLFWIGLFIAAYIQYFVVVGGFDQEAFAETIESKGEENVALSDFTPLVKPLISSLIYLYILNCFVTFFALSTISAKLNDDFSEDMKDAALYTLVCLLLMFIPVLGWIAVIAIIQRHYELSGGKTVFVIIIWIFYSGFAIFLLELPIQLFG